MHHERFSKKRCFFTSLRTPLFALKLGGILQKAQDGVRIRACVSDVFFSLSEDMLIGLSDDPPEILLRSPYKEGLLYFARNEPVEKAWGPCDFMDFLGVYFFLRAAGGCEQLPSAQRWIPKAWAPRRFVV